MGYLKAGDTISGQEAIAKISIKNPDGSTTLEDMFYGKDLEAKAEIKKTPVRTLGKRGEQHKPNSWTGTGNLTIYYVTSVFRRMALQYIKTGVPVYFDLIVTNTDPGSSITEQTVVLKNCSLDTVILAKFDVDTEVLDESIDFTFDDADMLDEFEAPILGVL